MLDIAFVMAEEFNIIFNFCFGMFKLQLSCDSNGPIQATVEEVVLSVKYAYFADVFFPTLACKLPPHALHDYAIEIGDG